VNFAQANSNNSQISFITRREEDILALDSGALRNTRATGGFLKIAHTKKKILVQIFGPKIQDQN
jgi:hypothetical protein